MSSVIDNRIVSMVFDNAKFEKGVADTQKTLKNLDKSIDDCSISSSKSFKSMAQAFNSLADNSLSKIGNSVENISSKFSALGIMGVTALQHIASQAVDAGEKLVKSLTIDQLSAGWNKYEQKTASVQTIVNATGASMDTVNAQLEKLMWFTDETSYNFVDMVSNVGKFTANNIDLDTAVTAMEGISNWAAISGQNAASASRAMYNLSQAIGMGSVKVQDWMSIENANMATSQFKQAALDAAVAVGTLTKAVDGTYKTAKGTAVTVQNFRTTLSEGWFSSEALTKVLGEYGSVTNKLYELSEASGASATDILSLVEAQKKGEDISEQLAEVLSESSMSAEEFSASIQELSSEENEFGIKTFQAAQEAKTLSDAIDAIKDAASSGWMKTWEIIFGDYEKARHVWTDLANDLYDIFVDSSNARNDLLEGANNSSWEQLSKKIADAGGDVEKFQVALEKVAKKHGVTLDEWIKKDGSFALTLRRNWLTSDMVIEALEEINDGTAAAASSAKKTEITMAEAKTLAEEIWSGKWGHGDLEVTKNLEEAGYNAERVLRFANLTLAGYELTEDSLKGMTKEAEVAESAVDGANKSLDQLIAEARESGSSLNDLITDMSQVNASEAFLAGMKNAFSALKDAIATVKTAFSNIFPPITEKTIQNIAVKFFDFTENIKNAVSENEHFQKALEGVFTTVKSVGTVFTAVFQFIKPVLEIFKMMAAPVVIVFEKIRDIGKWIDKFTRGSSPLVTIAQSFSNIISIIIAKLKELSAPFAKVFGSKAYNLAFGHISNIVTKLKTFANSISDSDKQMEIATKVVDKIVSIFGHLTSLDFSGFLKDLGLSDELIAKLEEKFSKIAGVSDSVSNAFTKIKDAIKSLRKETEEISSDKSDVNTEKPETVFSKLSAAFSNFKENLDFGSLLKSVKDALVSAFSKLFSSLFGENGILKGKLKEGINVLFSNLGTIASLAVKLAAAFALFRGGKMFSEFKKIGNVFEAVTNFLKGGSLEKKSKTLSSLATALRDVAIAVGIFAAAVYVLGNMPAEQAQDGLIRLGIILGEMVAVMALLQVISKIGGKTKGMASTLIGMSLSLIILVDAIKKIVELDATPEQLRNAEKVILSLGLILAAISAITGKSARLGGGLALIATAFAIMELFKVVKKIVQFAPDDASYKALKNAEKVILALGGILAVISLIVGASKINIRKGIGMLLEVAALAAVFSVIKQIVALTPDAESEAKLQNAEKVILALSAVLAAFSLLIGFSKINVRKGIGALLAVGAIYLVVNALKKLEDCEIQPDTIVKLAASLAVVAIGMNLLSGSFGAMLTAALAIAAIGVSVATVLFLVGKAFVPFGEGLKVFSEALEPISTGLKTFEGLDLGTSLKAILSLFAIIATIGIPAVLAGNAFSKLGTMADGLKAFFAVVPELVEKIVQISSYSGDAISSGLKIVEDIMIGSAISNIVANIGSFLGNYGTLAKAADGMLAFLNKAPELLQGVTSMADYSIVEVTVGLAVIEETLIGTAIGNLTANIGSFLGSYGTLVEAADGMLAFLGKAPALLEGITGLSGYSFEGVTAGLAVIEETLIGTSVDNLIANIGTFLGSYETLGEAASGMLTFLNSAPELLEKITAMASYSLVDVTLGLAVIEESLIGTAIGNLTASVGQLLGDYTTMSDAATKMIAFLALAPDLLDGITLAGSYSLEGVDAGLENIRTLLIGTAISNILASVGEVFSNYDTLESAATNFTAFLDKASPMVSKVSDLSGYSTDEISNGMHVVETMLIGTAISNILTSVGELVGNYTSLTDAADGLSAFLDNSSGLPEKIIQIGEYDEDGIDSGLGVLIKLFGTATLGSLMTGLADKLIDLTSMESAADALQTATDKSEVLADSLIALGQKGSLDDGLNALNSIINATLWEGIKTNVAGFFSDTEGIGAVADSLSAFMMNADTLVAGFTKFGELTNVDTAMSNINKMIELATSGLKNKEVNQFNSIVASLIGLANVAEEFAVLETSLKSDLIETVGNVISEAIANAQTYTESTNPSWYSVGTDAGEGYKSGVLSKAKEIADAAAKMVRDAIVAAKREQHSNSPSKEFAKLGSYGGQGYALGLASETGNVESTASKFVGSAIRIAQTSSELIANALSSDCIPTITPVMDLSSVRSGINTINGMSVSPFAISATSNISRGMSAIQNAQSQPKVVSLDGNTLSTLAASSPTMQSPQGIVLTVNYTGSLAQLATVLQPKIDAEYDRHGMSLIKRGAK